MGRQVRRVPANWQHPKDKHGNYIPMHEHFPYNAEEIKEGFREGWLKNDDPPNYGIDVMPQWPEKERTHLQMYETTSEGSPISPVMNNAEELAHWLADNKANAFAGRTASYEQWLATIQKGGSVSAAFIDRKIISGVELNAQ